MFWGRLADFTVMPRIPGNFRHLLVLGDTLSGWDRKVFPARSETVAQVAKGITKRNNPPRSPDPGLGFQDPWKVIVVPHLCLK